MKRATFMKFKDKMILKCDLSSLDSAEKVDRVVSYFLSMVKQMPPKSLVGLVDFTDLKVADEVVSEMIHLRENCNPHFRATA
ncbi:MAG: hypothetical protein OET90_03650, partial [Desulfuromonadales bacterium]|nr:hypothetical protein [Desulfuromonadales bacterium]